MYSAVRSRVGCVVVVRPGVGTSGSRSPDRNPIASAPRSTLSLVPSRLLVAEESRRHRPAPGSYRAAGSAAVPAAASASGAALIGTGCRPPMVAT